MAGLGMFLIKGLEKIERVNVTWNDNDTITYQQAKWWYFDQENSRGSLDDEIVTLNVVSLTAAFTVRDWNYFLRTSVSTAIRMTEQHIHIRRTVRELLFEGYSDRLINMARSMPVFSSVKVPFDKFAWFYKRNGTSFMDGTFNMNTGVGDIQKIGKLENWNYRTSTDYFPGECGNVEGTTGQLFPPGQTRTDKVHMFSPDLCRSISFEYNEDTVVSDIPGYKYVGGLSMLDNGTVFPDNECFCNGECVPSGVVNVTSCRFGAPAFASFPHFYLGDSYFTDNVRGMQPAKEKHQFYLVLEPVSYNHWYRPNHLARSTARGGGHAPPPPPANSFPSRGSSKIHAPRTIHVASTLILVLTVPHAFVRTGKETVISAHALIELQAVWFDLYQSS
ncbi:hypothetical protein J6590_018513 [Homalodisca vitripennis]|nr:hypothetical protein J6590_018513 [Homalodisca vitripennis]